VSGRSLEDKILAMNIDKPIGDGYEYVELETPFKMNLVGLTGVDRKDSVELYLVNNRPSLNTTTGELLDQTKVGANSTIEHLRVRLGAQEVQHLRTFHEPAITTPNNIATRGDGSFYITNDHGPHKTGYRHHLSPLLKDGDVTYCNEGGCRQVESGIGFPNGLSFGPDGLLYVPSSFSGNVRVYKTLSDGGIEHVEEIPLPYPLDNLSLDSEGTLWVPGLPDIRKTLSAFEDPLGKTPPATAFRIRKVGELYEVEKVLEDAQAEVLPASTAVVHDGKTGRIFLSGVFAPFITVCEPKKIAA
jgi:arylesterase / paraoxonase